MNNVYLKGAPTPLPSESSKYISQNRCLAITCFAIGLIALIGMVVAHQGVNSIATYTLLGFSLMSLSIGLLFLFQTLKEKSAALNLSSQQSSLFDYALFDEALRLNNWNAVAHQISLEGCPFKSIKKLYYAVKAQRIDLVKDFAQAGVDFNGFTEESGGQFTLLHEAIRLVDWEKACEISLYLIEKGARIDLETKEEIHRHLLFLLVERNSFTPFDEKKSKELFQKFVGIIDPKDQVGRTPLLWIVSEKEKPSREIIKLFVEYGADIALTFQTKTELQIYQNRFSEEVQDPEIVQLLTPKTA